MNHSGTLRHSKSHRARVQTRRMSVAAMIQWMLRDTPPHERDGDESRFVRGDYSDLVPPRLAPWGELPNWWGHRS